MKKTITVLVLAVGITIAACGGDKASAKADSTAAAIADENDVLKTPEYKAGLALVEASDCATCHKLNEKFTGPSYVDIANKYEATDANIATLADKVMNGGYGVWGQVPMAAHADVKKEDAIKMVKYILLTKKI